MELTLTDRKTRLIKMPRAKLSVHPVAQRKLKPARINKLMGKFDLDLIGTLIVVQQKDRAKDGLLVVNGQHRIEVFDLLFPDAQAKKWEFDCEVHRVKNDAEASLLALGANDADRWRRIEEFAMRVNGGEPVAVAINRAVEQIGFGIADQRADGRIACISTLERLQRWGVLEFALHLDREAWGKRYAAYEGSVLGGVGHLLHKMNGKLERSRLLNAMQKYPGGPAALAGDAKGRLRFSPGKRLTWCVAALLADAYNKGSRGSRVEWK